MPERNLDNTKNDDLSRKNVDSALHSFVYSQVNYYLGSVKIYSGENAPELQLKELDDKFSVYEEKILHKYTSFIGPFAKGNSNLQHLNIKDFYPTTNVYYFADAKIAGDGVHYIFYENTRAIGIDENYQGKQEAFTKAVLERYSFRKSQNSSGTGIRFIEAGFAKQIIDNENLTDLSENKALYDGLILALSREVIKEVEGREPSFLFKPYRGNICAKELAIIAARLREMANANDYHNYSPQNDTLLYALFVSGDLSESRKVVDGRYGKGFFDLINSEMSQLAKEETHDGVKLQYDGIRKRIKEKTETKTKTKRIQYY